MCNPCTPKAFNNNLPRKNRNIITTAYSKIHTIILSFDFQPLSSLLSAFTIFYHYFLAKLLFWSWMSMPPCSHGLTAQDFLLSLIHILFSVLNHLPLSLVNSGTPSLFLYFLLSMTNSQLLIFYIEICTSVELLF